MMTRGGATLQCESKKIPPPEVFWHFFPNGWEFLDQILLLLCAPVYARLQIVLFNYLQLWRSYTILSMTTHFILCAQNVHHRSKRTLAFSNILPKQLGIFSPNFTCLLYIHTYARMQIFIQLSPTVTKLCHFKCDHPACVSAYGGHFEHMMVVVLSIIIWHNFVKVADNWIKICSQV